MQVLRCVFERIAYKFIVASVIEHTERDLIGTIFRFCRLCRGYHSNSFRRLNKNGVLASLPALAIKQCNPHLSAVDLPRNRILRLAMNHSTVRSGV